MSVTTTPIDDSETLFTVTFNSTIPIHTTVSVSSAIVSSWISAVSTSRQNHPQSQPLIVGLDCEWRPNLNPRQDNRVALLQLCVPGGRCLLFQLIHSDAIPQTLLTFLKDPRFTFVGVGIDEDLEKLIVDYGIEVGNRKDLRDLAVERTGKREVKQMGLKGLANEVMGVEVKKPKKVTMSRWDQEWLTLDQIGYASVDAWLSFEIGRRLLAGESSEW